MRSNILHRLQKPCPSLTSGRIKAFISGFSCAFLMESEIMKGESSMSESMNTSQSPVAISAPRGRWRFLSGPEVSKITDGNFLQISGVLSVEKLSMTMISVFL